MELCIYYMAIALLFMRAMLMLSLFFIKATLARHEADVFGWK